MSDHSKVLTYNHIAKALASSDVPHEQCFSVMENFAREHHLSENLQLTAIKEMMKVYESLSGVPAYLLGKQ